MKVEEITKVVAGHYYPFDGGVAPSTHFAAFLNGNQVDFCREADSKEGWVKVMKVDKNLAAHLDENGEVIEEIIHGDVKLVYNEDMIDGTQHIMGYVTDWKYKKVEEITRVAAGDMFFVDGNKVYWADFDFKMNKAPIGAFAYEADSKEGWIKIRKLKNGEIQYDENGKMIEYTVYGDVTITYKGKR